MSLAFPKFIFASFLLWPLASAPAAVTYATAGQTYLQDFNSLSSSGGGVEWINNVTLPNWHWAVSNQPPTGFFSPGSYYAEDGSGPRQGAPLSLGTAGSLDRALGGQNNNNGGQVIVYGFSLQNATGSTLSQFTLGYTGEQWRAIANSALSGPGNLQVEYQIFNAGGGNISTASGWMTVDALAYTASFVPATNMQVNGNNASYRQALSGIVSGLNWTSGQELWLRWVDNHPVPDNGNYATLSMIGIDDVFFTASAVPEPHRVVLLCTGLVGVLWGWRRRSS